MNQKYTIVDGRCVAIRDFSDVKTGDVGGRLESERNLSHAGDCWVFGDARVSGNTRVFGDARVSGNTRVFGDAWVFGDAN